MSVAMTPVAIEPVSAAFRFHKKGFKLVMGEEGFVFLTFGEASRFCCESA